MKIKKFIENNQIILLFFLLWIVITILVLRVNIEIKNNKNFINENHELILKNQKLIMEGDSIKHILLKNDSIIITLIKK